MILSRRVALGGVQLDSLDDRIVIQGVEETAGRDAISAVDFGARSGQRVTGRRRELLDITVHFGVDIPKGNYTDRETVLETVNSWAANGGWLTLGHKPGRRLSVVLAQPAAISDVRAWNTDYSMVFRAYAVPYWEAAEAVSAETTGNSTTITVPGNAGTQADVIVENTGSSTVNALTVAVTSGGRQRAMVFSSLGLAAGEKLVIDHEAGLLRIRIQASGGSYRSAMIRRNDESADDFAVVPGTVQCQLTISGAHKLTVSARGRWL